MRYQLLFISAILYFVSSTPSYGQEQEIKLDFGKITEEELSMQVYEKDTSASAVILGDYGQSVFVYNEVKGIQLVFTRHTRIKILNSNGYDWADIRIPLYHNGSDKEAVGQVKGFTYNLVDGKIEKDKLKGDAKFSEKITDNIDAVIFTMPNVKEGSVIEYSYTVTSDFLFNLWDWEFQSTIPTIWSEYKVKIPEYYQYKHLYQGYETFVIHENYTERGTFNTLTKTRSSVGLRGNNGATTFTNNEIAFMNYCSRWAVKDAPAMIEEPYITSMSDYVTKMEFELASIQVPGSTYENYTRTWENIDKELLDDEDFGGQLKKGGLVKSEVMALTNNTSDPIEKMALIYNHVKMSYKWNENNGISSRKGLKKVIEEKSGSAGDINLLLTLMLKEGGLTAHPVVLSTRSNGILKTALPMLSQLNYVISYVVIDGKTYLLDATDPFSNVNLLPVRCLNEKGRIVSDMPGEKWVSLEPNCNSGDFFMANLAFKENDVLTGTVSESRNNYMAMQHRSKLAKKTTTNNREEDELTSDMHNWEIENYEIENLEKLHEPIKESYQLTFTDHYQTAGNLIYLNPFISRREESNPFKLEERKYPVDIPHPFNSTYILNLTIPEGYGIDELPENVAIALPNNAGTFIYSVKVRGNLLQVMSKVDISQRKFVPLEYPYLKAFFDQMVSKQSEQIVLKKI
jgi:hypothetical protein